MCLNDWYLLTGEETTLKQLISIHPFNAEFWLMLKECYVQKFSARGLETLEASSQEYTKLLTCLVRARYTSYKILSLIHFWVRLCLIYCNVCLPIASLFLAHLIHEVSEAYSMCYPIPFVIPSKPGIVLLSGHFLASASILVCFLTVNFCFPDCNSMLLNFHILLKIAYWRRHLCNVYISSVTVLSTWVMWPIGLSWEITVTHQWSCQIEVND